MTGATAGFEAERPRLLGLAYRILGSVADAEDVVQEAWLRWAAAGDGVERPEAWLTTVTTRLALDRLGSAARRREGYVGPWLPEPVVTTRGPEETAELADSLTLGFLALLDQLDPLARVVLLLADVYGHPYADVAEAVGKTPDACRQIASRARRRLQAASLRRPLPAERRTVDALVAAIMTGESDRVVELLAPEVVLVSDGGPHRHAARRPVVTPFRVTRLLMTLSRRVPPGATMEAIEVNGAGGLLVRDAAGQPDVVVGVEVHAERVAAIWVVTNPDKLAHLDRPLRIT